MEFLAFVGFLIATLVAIFLVGWFCVALWTGLDDGWTDARLSKNRGYEHLAESALRHPPVTWHGWYLAFYSRKAWQDWSEKNDLKERRNDRRRKAMDRRDERRRKVLNRSGI